MLNSLKNRNSAALLLIAFFLFSGGCSGQEESPIQGAISRGQQSEAVVVSPEKGEPARILSVALFPTNPRVGDALQAVISGKEKGVTIRWMRNGELLEGQMQAILPAHNFVKGDTIAVAVESEDRQSQASITILNSPPEVISIPFANPFVVCGTDIVAEPEAVDEDGDSVYFRYAWSINGEEVIGNDSPLLSADSFCKGDRIALEVVPYDEDGPGKAFRGKGFVIPNSPPAFVSTPPLQFKERIYAYEARAADPDGDRLAYSLESAPSGMTIDNAIGDIRWPIEAGSAGEHHVRIAARDEEGMNAFQEFTLSLEIAAQEEN